MIGQTAASQGHTRISAAQAPVAGVEASAIGPNWARSTHRYSQVFHRPLVILYTQLSTGSSRPKTAPRGHC